MVSEEQLSPTGVLLSEGERRRSRACRGRMWSSVWHFLRSAMAGGEFRCKGAVIAALRERGVLVKVRHKAKASGRVGRFYDRVRPPTRPDCVFLENLGDHRISFPNPDSIHSEAGESLL